MSKLRHVNPPGLCQASGYSHAVAFSGPGDIIHIAGELPIDAQGQLVGNGDFYRQAIKVFENLETALKAAGAGFGDVAKFTTFLTDMSNRSAFHQVRAAYVDAAKAPAGTLIEVSGLAVAGAMIEIEAIAILAAGSQPLTPGK
jgi:enamine deaminase RidA (YjgF/YER057c/UK114 family)